MPRGISKDLKNFKETLEKGVILVGGEVVDNNSIDPDDDAPVSVAIIVDVTGYGPHVGAISAVQGGHPDAALEVAHEILEEWERDHYPEADEDTRTETFDGQVWTLPVEDFVAAIKGTPAEKHIDIVEYEDEDEDDETDDEYRVLNYDTGETLDGPPSPELIEESLAADPTGAVPAFQDSVGTWQYVPPSEVDFYKHQRKEDVITVYVEER